MLSVSPKRQEIKRAGTAITTESSGKLLVTTVPAPTSHLFPFKSLRIGYPKAL